MRMIIVNPPAIPYTLQDCLVLPDSPHAQLELRSLTESSAKGRIDKDEQREMDFRPKNLFAVTTQKSCTDVFISSVYMFMLKQKEKIKGEKKKHNTQESKNT